MGQSMEFLVGQLSQAVESLTRQVEGLRRDTVYLSKELTEIKLFRAKVLGAALVVSILSSAVFSLAMAAWVK